MHFSLITVRQLLLISLMVLFDYDVVERGNADKEIEYDRSHYDEFSCKTTDTKTNNLLCVVVVIIYKYIILVQCGMFFVQSAKIILLSNTRN